MVIQVQKYVDPRVLRTQKAFEDALLRLLINEDFEKITVCDIAKEANLSRATFYLHYEDKEDLLEKYLQKALEAFAENANICQEEFSYDISKPHPLFVRIFTHIQDNFKFYKIMLAKETESPILYSVLNIIRTVVEYSNEILKEHNVIFAVDDRLAKVYYTHAYLGTIIWWIQNDMPITPEAMAEQLTRLSTTGPFEENPFLR